MDSFEWHEAEQSLIRATAARIICETPGTDLTDARQISMLTRSGDRSPQSGDEAQELPVVETTQLTELTSKPSGDTAIPNTLKIRHYLPLQGGHQFESAQSMDNKTALQISQHENVAPEQPSQDGYAASAGTSTAERGFDDEKNEQNTVSGPSKATQSPPCDNCQIKHAKCSRARPRCRRCKENKEKCIYSQDNEGDTDSPKRLLRGLACSECGRKGLKCTGERPECGKCKELMIECVYKDRGVKPLGVGEIIL